MARINLRPWREERRAEQQREFLGMLAGFAVLGLVYIFLANMQISSSIENQQARNNFLSSEIAILDDKIKEIDELRKKRDELIERMRVIQELQGNRPVIVYLFDELVRTLPDGLYYSSLERKGETISLQGLAESNNRISTLMRRLDASDWFEQPNLTSVKALDEDGSAANQFVLSVKRYVQAEDEEG